MTPNQTNTISLLLASIDGSGRLRGKIGDAEAGHAINRCQRRALHCIEMFDGQVVDSSSQRIIVLFGSPDTACRAALEIQEKMATLPPARGLAVEVQIACAHGQGQIVGNAVRGAIARNVDALMKTCIPGHVLIDAQTHQRLPPDHQRCFLALASTPAIPAGERFFRFVRDSGASATDSAPATAAMPPVEATRPATPTPVPHGPRLRLYHAGNRITLASDDKQTFTIGRDRGCHLPIASARVSRLHAWIYADGGQFILRDQSTNGTFLKIGAGPEIHLRHQESVLRGKGSIGIAGSTQKANTEQIEFQVL